MSKPQDAMYEYPAEWPGKFVKACTYAGIQPTKRQWRKWCRGVGSAYISRKKTVNN